MFLHVVLFRIRPKDVPTYVRDCRMWIREASRHRGFITARTLRRTNEKNQHASTYVWRSSKDHFAFMKKHHDRLVSLSRCPVEVLGYYNFNTHPK